MYNRKLGVRMNPDHDYFSASINPFPTTGELNVLFSGEGQPQCLHRIGPAIHDYYLIHTVLSGKGEFIIRDKKYNCSAGDTFIIFPGSYSPIKQMSLSLGIMYG